MRHRVEYLHLATSGRLIFTVSVDGHEGMARAAGNAWLHASGLHLTDFVFLSVVRLREDGRADTTEASCDILSRVRVQYPDRGTLLDGLQVGRDDQSGRAPDSGESVLAP